MNTRASKIKYDLLFLIQADQAISLNGKVIELLTSAF